MRKSNRLFILFLLFISIAAHAKKPSSIVVFGDSLSDNGNACPRGECISYPDQRFTDKGGWVWSELLAAKLGFTLQPSRFGGNNFAFGGAESGVGTANTPGVLSQISTYLEQQRGGYADPNALYVIWIGGNDVKNKVVPIDLLNNVRQGLQTLIHRGAQHFIVPNLPPIHEVLAATTAMDTLSLAASFAWNWVAANKKPQRIDVKSLIAPIFDFGISQYNEYLNDALTTFKKENRVDICQPDMFALFKDVSANPKKYGFKTAADLFCFDLFHPSAPAHAVIAKAIAKQCGFGS